VKLKSTRLNLYAGIHDGHTGSVPVSHSLRFYNKLLRDMGVKQKQPYVSEAEMEALLNRKPLPNDRSSGNIGNRPVLYRKAYGPVRLIVFEGGHEMLPEAALEGLEE
jgi:hypothetical protein